jgi:peroxiredoxin family protein
MAEKLAIIATKGTLDMAYPPLILASTAASLGVETAIFFTFYGLNIIHKQKMNQLKIAPIGNPAMPMAFPPSMQNPTTNAISSILPGPPQIMGIIPGMTDLMTYMMKKTIKEHGVARHSRAYRSLQRGRRKAHTLPDDHGALWLQV